MPQGEIRRKERSPMQIENWDGTIPQAPKLETTPKRTSGCVPYDCLYTEKYRYLQDFIQRCFQDRISPPNFEYAVCVTDTYHIDQPNVRNHAGTDIQWGGGGYADNHPMRSGKVIAPFSGTVVFVKEDEGLVVILDAQGRFVIFRHLTGITVTAGVNVRVGAVVGNPGAVNLNGRYDQQTRKWIPKVRNPEMAVHLHVEVGYTAPGSKVSNGVYPSTDIFVTEDPATWLLKSNPQGYASVSDGLQADEEHRAVVATAGNDVMYGGDKNDQINGADGNDTLHGGKGNDCYYVNTGDGTDTIEDNEGTANRVIINGRPIGDFVRQTDGTYSSLLIDPNTRESVFTGIMQSGYFVVTETASGTQVFLNHDFEEGDFGIHFRDERNPWATPATSYTIQGDLTPVDPIHYDQWGNVITTAQPDEGRADTLYDTPGNDLIVCGAGDDVVIAHCGG